MIQVKGLSAGQCSDVVYFLRTRLEALAGEHSSVCTLDQRPVLLYSGKAVLFD